MKQITNTSTNIIKTASGKTARLISGWTPLASDRTTIEGPSMTVPNMSYEIKDLLTNYKRGIDLIGELPEPMYDDNPSHNQADISAVNRMDIQEQSEFIKSQVQKSKDLQTKIKQQIEANKKLEGARKEAPSEIPPLAPTKQTGKKEE